jgi:ribosomal protein L34
MSKYTLNGSKKKSLKTSGFRARRATKSGQLVLKRRRKKRRCKLTTIVCTYKHQITNGKNLTGKKIKKQKSLLIKARKKVIKSPQILSDPDKQREQEKRRQERQKRKDQVLESISKNKRISKNQIKRDAEKEKKSLTEVQS